MDTQVLIAYARKIMPTAANHYSRTDLRIR